MDEPGHSTKTPLKLFIVIAVVAAVTLGGAAPPKGTRSDYLAFFWGYAVAIVAIGVVAADWLRRRAAEAKDGA